MFVLGLVSARASVGSQNLRSSCRGDGAKTAVGLKSLDYLAGPTGSTQVMGLVPKHSGHSALP